MKTVTTIAELRKLLDAGSENSVGFVPTMGALHAGHLSLVEAARRRTKCVVVSIFVNPTQFGPHEDFARYPRDLGKDAALLEAAGVDILFAPAVEEIYGTGSTTWITVEGLGERNEGRMRPGHFRGVATVVAKLFNIVQPQVAFFGQKDAAQLAVVRRMTRDLHFPIEIAACPIVREPDGLAMSSRNAYLSADDRRRGLVLHRALQKAEATFAAGARDARAIISAAQQEFESAGVKPDYIELLDPDTLEPVKQVSEPALLAVAAKIGATRLLDNVILGV